MTEIRSEEYPEICVDCPLNRNRRTCGLTKKPFWPLGKSIVNNVATYTQQLTRKRRRPTTNDAYCRVSGCGQRVTITAIPSSTDTRGFSIEADNHPKLL